MPVVALGLSCRRAPVDLLERLSFPEDDEIAAYRRLLGVRGISEAVIVSTCNRVEVYAAVEEYRRGVEDLKGFLAESRNVPVEEFADPAYAYRDERAVEHLFAVASGLDSMVVGEPQILQQVRASFWRAEAEGAQGPLLAGLFMEAVRVGRRVRRETGVGASPAAFAEAGVALAAERLGGLERRSAVVVGAGQVAAFALRALQDRRVAGVQVLNRTPERAARLAGRAGAEHGSLDDLVPAMARSDLVVCSTGATGVVVDAAAVRAARVQRAGPTAVVDLAVPRDVDPAVRRLPGVWVVDIEDLRVAVSHRHREVSAEVDRAWEMVTAETRRFMARRRGAWLAPLIGALHARGEDIRTRELQRFASRLAGLSEKERDAVEALASGIVAKLLHDPVIQLKRLAAEGLADQHARVLAELFSAEAPPEGWAGSPPPGQRDPGLTEGDRVPE